MSETLKRAIERDGRSLAELARAAELDAGRLSRFVRGERTLTLRAADQLAAALGLVLVPREQRAKARKATRRSAEGDRSGAKRTTRQAGRKGPGR